MRNYFVFLLIILSAAVVAQPSRTCRYCPPSPVGQNGKVYASDGTNIVLTTTGSGINYWQLSGSNLSPIDDTYNVGIGTTTPQAKLHINGNILQGDTTTANTKANTVLMETRSESGINYYFSMGDTFPTTSVRLPHVGFSQGDPIGLHGVFILEGHEYLPSPGDTFVSVAGIIDNSGSTSFRAKASAYSYDIQARNADGTGTRYFFDTTNLYTKDDNYSSLGRSDKRWSGLFTTAIQLTDGNEGEGKVATSDASGNMIWQGAVYGSYYDTINQVNHSTTSAIFSTCNSILEENGITKTNDSTFHIAQTGVYQFFFSSQVSKTDGGTDNVRFWLRQNGSDLPFTSEDIALTTTNATHIITWQYVQTFNAGDDLNLMWQSDDADLFLETRPRGTTPNTPASPSMVVTINKIK